MVYYKYIRTNSISLMITGGLIVMVKYATRKRLAVLAAAGMTALAFGLYPASAADESAVTSLYPGISASASQSAPEKKKSLNIDQHIQSFVTDGTITQSQADILKAAVQNSLTERKQSAETHRQKWTALKEQLTQQAGLTQAQSDAVFPAPPAKGSSERDKREKPSGERMKSPESRIQSLADNGTITASQASVLSQGLRQNAVSSRNDMKLFQEKETAEKAAAARQAGISDEVMNRIFPGLGFFPPHEKRDGMHRSAYRMRTEKIRSLTADGTITQKQADQLNNALIDFDQALRSGQNSRIKADMDFREKAAKDAHVSPEVVDEVFGFHRPDGDRGSFRPKDGPKEKPALSGADSTTRSPAVRGSIRRMTPADKIQELQNNGTLNEKQAGVLKEYIAKADSQRKSDRLSSEKDREQARAQLIKKSGVSAAVIDQLFPPAPAGPRR